MQKYKIKIKKHNSFFHEDVLYRNVNGYSWYDCNLFVLYFFQIKYKRNAIKCITQYMKSNKTHITYKKGKISKL